MKFLFLFFLILMNLNFFLFFQTESIILFIGFFFTFFYLVFHPKMDSLFFTEEEEFSFLEELDWYITMNFFLKIKNWYRFFYRATYYKLNTFYKFVFALKKYILSWLRKIFYLLKKRFVNLNLLVTLTRLSILEKYKKLNKYKNNPFCFLII